ncbi:MAG: hypothetical protein Q9195_002497, partial [Heterodermia aff. obscurata]
MGANLVRIVVGATFAVIILCVALFFALKCLRRRRPQAIDEETSSISSESTEDAECESLTSTERQALTFAEQQALASAEQQAVDHMAICRRVVPCFASAEYEGPTAREGRFVYGGSLLDNVQQPSAEDLARAGYEPVPAPGGPTVFRAFIRIHDPQAEASQTQQ